MYYETWTVTVQLKHDGGRDIYALFIGAHVQACPTRENPWGLPKPTCISGHPHCPRTFGSCRFHDTRAIPTEDYREGIFANIRYLSCSSLNVSHITIATVRGRTSTTASRESTSCSHKIEEDAAVGGSETAVEDTPKWEKKKNPHKHTGTIRQSCHVCERFGDMGKKKAGRPTQNTRIRMYSETLISSENDRCICFTTYSKSRSALC